MFEKVYISSIYKCYKCCSVRIQNNVTLITWLVFVTIQEPIDVDDVASTSRKKLFEKTYSFQDGEFKIESAEGELKKRDANMEICHVFLSHSARDQKYASFISLCLRSLLPDVKVHHKSSSSNSNDEVQFLHSAQVLVVILSSSYVRSPKEVEEFNVILSRERSAKDVRHLYVIRVNEIPRKPTYFHLVHCDTALDDQFWYEVLENKVKVTEAGSKSDDLDIGSEYRKARVKVEDKQSKLKDVEVLALMKAFSDIRWKLEGNRSVMH